MPTTYTIYPAIGIARVGNAPEAFYIGPETANGLPILPDGAAFTPAAFRDEEGRIRRQAARFRIFRQTDGGPAEEVTLDTPGVAAITWRVHLANKKASWYEFQTSRGEHGYSPNHPLRNFTAPDRHALVIDAGPRAITGRDQAGVRFSRDSMPTGYRGSFPPPTLKPDPIDTLGELRTDALGRLLVLGGLGRAGSTDDPPALAQYANNDGWFDDTSDGPIAAVIRVRDSGEEIAVEPAWVLVGPPSYAPQIPNLVTLYDTIFNAAVRHLGARPDIFEHEMWKGGEAGYRPYFETDIKPIFERVASYAWVTAVPPRPHTFDLARLGRPDPALYGLRKYYLDFLRAPGQENVLVDTRRGGTLMPYLAGDDCLNASDPGFANSATSKYLRVTDTQYFFLRQWADGYFHAGAAPAGDPGAALTRGVLDNCVGGAFSPGIEMSWISRNPAIYKAPFRIKSRPPAAPLSLGADPAAGMEPGDITRYMAVPWQADFNECSSQEIVGRVLWWWPAQRPEFVYLHPKDREHVHAGPHALVSPAFGPQVGWLGTTYDQNAPDYIGFQDNLEMVKRWFELGFVYNIGTDDDPHFVEVERRPQREQ